MSSPLEVTAPAVTNTPTDGTWQDLTLTSPFTVYSSAVWTPQIMRKNGIVYIRGAANKNAAANGATIATLPTGYRPSAEWRYTNDTEPATTSSGRVTILATGAIRGYLKTGTPTAYHLHTSFPAEG